MSYFCQLWLKLLYCEMRTKKEISRFNTGKCILRVTFMVSLSGWVQNCWLMKEAKRKLLLNHHFSKISITTARNMFLKAVCSKFLIMFSSTSYLIFTRKKSLLEVYFKSIEFKRDQRFLDVFKRQGTQKRFGVLFCTIKLVQSS